MAVAVAVGMWLLLLLVGMWLWLWLWLSLCLSVCVCLRVSCVSVSCVSCVPRVCSVCRVCPCVSCVSRVSVSGHGHGHVYVYVYVCGGGGGGWQSQEKLQWRLQEILTRKSFVKFFSWERKTNRTISRLVLPMFLQDNWSLTALLGKANDWRNREHVVLDLFSNLNMGNIQWLLSVNLWGQVITLRA